MSSILVLLCIVLGLIATNAFFVAAEFALISVPRPRIEQLAAEGNRGARTIHRVISQAASQDRYVATAQLGLSLASLGLGMYAEEALVHLLTPRLAELPFLQVAAAHSLAVFIVLTVLTFSDILLGEMVPKSIALVNAESTALRVIWPMRWIERLLGPLVWLLNQLGRAVLRALRMPVSKDISFVYSPEELRLIFEESHEGGLLEGEEHELMQKVMNFGKRAVRQVMVSRTRAVGVPLEATVGEALAVVARDGYTRYPVFERDMDHIVGFVHVKDLVRCWARTAEAPQRVEVRKLMRDIPHVPESMWTSELFDKMKIERVQIAVVLDEHGGTAGIVTMEDLIEEIFGEVRDEFDVEEEEPIVRLSGDTVRVQGTVSLTDLAEELDRDLELEDVETVNGLVMDELGRPPRVGDLIEAQGLRILVETVQERVVGTARITDLVPKPPPEGDEEEWDST
jgi:CBS domain containing-hemolysin-like protein